MKYVSYLSALLLFISFFTLGCVSAPDEPSDTIKTNNITYGAFILNESQRGSDNASITKYDLLTHLYDNFYFRRNNTNLKLGDNANDIVIWDSLCYVSVSGAGTIEVFSVNSGISKGRIIFPQYVMPRKMCFVNDTLAFITAYEELYDENYVFYFNPSDLATSQQNISNNKISVGSHPEGICYNPSNQLLYVVNSGYGDLDAEHPLASTISIIDINTMTLINNIKTNSNPNKIYYNNGKLYVVCWGLHLTDTSIIKGAILEYDPNSLYTPLNEWKSNVYDICFSTNSDKLYFINSTWNSNAAGDYTEVPGVYSIELLSASPTPILLIPNTNLYDMWTAVAINDFSNEIWVANSFRYTTNGEIRKYNFANLSLITNFAVGSVPNNIRFFGK